MNAIDTLRDIEKGVTPGEWTHGFHDGGGKCNEEEGGWIVATKDVAVVVGGRDSWGCKQGVKNAADAKFIAFTRKHWPQIVAVVEAAEKVIEHDETQYSQESSRELDYSRIIADLKFALSKLARSDQP